MVNEYLISAILVLLGNVAATVLPYWRKKYNAGKLPTVEDLKFEAIYLWNAIIAAVVQFVLAMPVIDTLNADGALGMLGLIILSFSYGYGGNKVQIEGGKLISIIKSILAAKDSPLP